MDVAIIGAGLGGLTLAIALDRAGHDVTVFERDPGPEARSQGHAIGLYPNLGLSALRQVGVASEVMSASCSVRGFSFRRWSGERIAGFELPDAGPPMFFGVPRAELRSILLRRLRTECVRWGVEVDRMESTPSHVELALSDGTRRRAALAVGCDGAFSKVRRDKLGVPWKSLGLVSVGGVVEPRDDLPAAHGFLSLAPGCSLYVQPRDASGSMIWALSCRANVLQESMDAGELRRLVLEKIERWHEPIPAMVEATQEATVGKVVLGDCDPLDAWASDRVTLIGDAAHPMSPFQGQGGNLALVDAVDLAGALDGVDSRDAVSAVRHFETSMLARSRPAVLRSREATRAFHTDDPETAVRAFVAR